MPREKEKGVRKREGGTETTKHTRRTGFVLFAHQRKRTKHTVLVKARTDPKVYESEN